MIFKSVHNASLITTMLVNMTSVMDIVFIVMLKKTVFPRNLRTYLHLTLEKNPVSTTFYLEKKLSTVSKHITL
jgi:hypothetical protein